MMPQVCSFPSVFCELINISWSTDTRDIAGISLEEDDAPFSARVWHCTGSAELERARLEGTRFVGACVVESNSCLVFLPAGVALADSDAFAELGADAVCTVQFQTVPGAVADVKDLHGSPASAWTALVPDVDLEALPHELTIPDAPTECGRLSVAQQCLGATHTAARCNNKTCDKTGLCWRHRLSA